MSHANARLTVHGWWLLVERIVFERRPASHVARGLGVSRQCAHRWVARFRAEGLTGLVDRSSRPYRSPSKTPAEAESRVLEARERLRFGPARLAVETGVAARTISLILNRHGVAPLAWLDPVTGASIRAHRCEEARANPGRRGLARARRFALESPLTP